MHTFLVIAMSIVLIIANCVCAKEIRKFFIEIFRVWNIPLGILFLIPPIAIAVGLVIGIICIIVFIFMTIADLITDNKYFRKDD